MQTVGAAGVGSGTGTEKSFEKGFKILLLLERNMLPGGVTIS